MNTAETLELIRSLRAEITALTMQVQILGECNDTQADKIKEGWVEIAALKKQAEHAQAYIPKLKAERDELKAQLTDQAKAERLFRK